ncbi:hypothetical protein RRG08_027277 [Elysia crispata]|uniref:Uncharacterized protein n=1 Tax=Elysia crispata TaxID=231223 RepID=A0AAE1ECL9_9GAST|nr:hypothetical protein RRG08_027277 [Elysia crispata]
MDSGVTIHQLCYQLSSVIGALRPSAALGYKRILLIFGIFLAFENQIGRLKQVLCVITAPISIIFSNQENTHFVLVSLCGFLCMGLIIFSERDGQMIKSLTASLEKKEDNLQMEDRAKEPNHKLQEKAENLHT